MDPLGWGRQIEIKDRGHSSSQYYTRMSCLKPWGPAGWWKQRDPGIKGHRSTTFRFSKNTTNASYDTPSSSHPSGQWGGGVLVRINGGVGRWKKHKPHTASRFRYPGETAELKTHQEHANTAEADILTHTRCPVVSLRDLRQKKKTVTNEMRRGARDDVNGRGRSQDTKLTSQEINTKNGLT